MCYILSHMLHSLPKTLLSHQSAWLILTLYHNAFLSTMGSCIWFTHQKASSLMTITLSFIFVFPESHKYGRYWINVWLMDKWNYGCLTRATGYLVGVLPSWHIYRPYTENPRRYWSISCNLTSFEDTLYGMECYKAQPNWDCPWIQKLVFYHLRQDEDSGPIRSFQSKMEKFTRLRHWGGRLWKVHLLFLPITLPSPLCSRGK